MSAYYNENDPLAAEWLRALILFGHIAPGDVDQRSIEDVRADDLRGYDQCHFFAGIGIWSHALRRAGWPDDRPVGTASCPCQGFSLAGKGLGFADPRHLWPAFLRLVDEARQQGQPWASMLIGEQVASAGKWLDLVQSDLEARAYAFAAVDLPAAGFAQGAHIRQRFYWVADLHDAERWADMAGRHFGDWPQAGRIEGYGELGAGGEAVGMAFSDGGNSSAKRQQRSREQRQQPADSGPGGMGHHHHQGLEIGSLSPDSRGAVRVQGPAAGASGSLRGCDWLLCRDGKVRPTQRGLFPLAVTTPGRVGLLRGYGNGLDAETAVNFIGAYLDAEMLL